MHVDRVRHGFQIQRPQMRDAMGEKRVLLAHDLGRDFQDGAGALIERATSQVAVCRQSVK